MSGVFKGVKKVFKKVGKVVKKILPFALPVAAAVFTIGGFMGIPAMAGGWGGAVGKLFGGGGLLGRVVGGAITQAGYGGLAGMAIGGITGGKKGMLKGSLIGQAAGAVMGGAMGAMSGPTAASQASAAGGAAPGQAPGAIPAAGKDLSASTAAMRSYGADLPGQAGVGASSGFVPAPIGQATSQAAQGITSTAQSLPSAGMVPGMAAAAPTAGQAALTGFKSLDPIVQASMITTAGAALPHAIGALTKSDEDENQQLVVERERRKAIADNYAGFGSAPSPSLSLGNSPTLRYEYDPSVGRIVPRYA